MAIIPNTAFPGKTDGIQPGYPQGKARNITVPSDGTGTPWDQLLCNDLFGWQQALLTRAGIVPSGNPDSTLASQYLDALDSLYISDSPQYNYADNPCFDIWQTGNTFNFAGAATGYTADQWHFSQTVGNTDITKVAAAASNNCPSLMLIDRTVGGSTIENALRIEGVRNFGGKKISVTYRYELLAGANLTVETWFRQFYGTGGAPSATIEGLMHSELIVNPSVNVVQFVFEIPDNGGKTLGTNGDDYIDIFFKYSDNIFTLRKYYVSVVPSKNIHDFQPTKIGEVLSRCQRYYQKSYDINVDPGSVTAIGIDTSEYGGMPNNAYTLQKNVRFATNMRGSPMVTTYCQNGAVGCVDVFSGNVIPLANQPSESGFFIQASDPVPTPTWFLNFHWVADARL